MLAASGSVVMNNGNRLTSGEGVTVTTTDVSVPEVVSVEECVAGDVSGDCGDSAALLPEAPVSVPAVPVTVPVEASGVPGDVAPPAVCPVEGVFPWVFSMGLSIGLSTGLSTVLLLQIFLIVLHIDRFF